MVRLRGVCGRSEARWAFRDFGRVFLCTWDELMVFLMVFFVSFLFAFVWLAGEVL